MAAVSSLPQLRERKRIIDKHTNMLTAILDRIKERGLDAYYHLEESCLSRKATLQQVADAVQVSMLSDGSQCCDAVLHCWVICRLAPAKPACWS